MFLSCPGSLTVIISDQSGGASDPVIAAAPAGAGLRAGERLKNQPVHEGGKAVLRVWRVNKGENCQFSNISRLNPAQSLHEAQLSAIKVKSQHRATAELCRGKCSCTAPTNLVVNVCVKVLPGLWAWSLSPSWGCLFREAAAGRMGGVFGSTCSSCGNCHWLAGLLSRSLCMHTNKGTAMAKLKMASAAVRNFLVHTRKMESRQENWEKEGKSLIKKTRADRNTKNRRPFKSWESVRKRKWCGGRGRKKRGTPERSSGVLDAAGSQTWCLCANCAGFIINIKPQHVHSDELRTHSIDSIALVGECCFPTETFSGGQEMS